jgi:hypothetical protein
MTSVQTKRRQVPQDIEVTEERIAREAARIAFTDRRGIWQDGAIKSLDQWTEAERSLLEEIEVRPIPDGDGRQRIVRVKLARKTRSIEFLARLKGLLVETEVVTRPARAGSERGAARPASTYGSEPNRKTVPGTDGPG